MLSLDHHSYQACLTSGAGRSNSHHKAGHKPIPSTDPSHVMPSHFAFGFTSQIANEINKPANMITNSQSDADKAITAKPMPVQKPPCMGLSRPRTKP